MDLVLIVFLSLPFPAVVLYSYLKSKRRRAAGREVIAVKAAQASRICVRAAFDLPDKKKWCRIRTTFTLAGPLTGYADTAHGYTLCLRSPLGEELVRETGTLTEFFCFCWRPGPGRSRPGPSLCDPVLLEFIPPEPGRYSVQFTLNTTEADSRLDAVTLHVHAGVWPLKHKPYRHICIDLRRHRPPQLKNAPVYCGDPREGSNEKNSTVGPVC